MRRLGASKADAAPAPAAKAAEPAKAVDSLGAALAVGDKVEAKYKGCVSKPHPHPHLSRPPCRRSLLYSLTPPSLHYSKGTRYFPGAITAIAPGAGGGEATCSILYDDGDREEGAVGANIRRLGPAAAKAAEAPSSGVGKAAEMSKGAWGEPANPTPSVSSSTAAGSSAAAEPRAKDANGLTLVVGDKVEARYKGKGAAALRHAHTRSHKTHTHTHTRLAAPPLPLQAPSTSRAWCLQSTRPLLAARPPLT